jgi:phytoene/squalene synthetase
MKDLRDLLQKTRRTFALSIPVLPEPTNREVMIAYLLFRIAETFEDAAQWQPEKRILSRHSRSPCTSRTREDANPPISAWRTFAGSAPALDANSAPRPPPRSRARR